MKKKTLALSVMMLICIVIATTASVFIFDEIKKVGLKNIVSEIWNGEK